MEFENLDDEDEDFNIHLSQARELTLSLLEFDTDHIRSLNASTFQRYLMLLELPGVAQIIMPLFEQHIQKLCATFAYEPTPYLFELSVLLSYYLPEFDRVFREADGFSILERYPLGNGPDAIPYLLLLRNVIASYPNELDMDFYGRLLRKYLPDKSATVAIRCSEVLFNVFRFYKLTSLSIEMLSSLAFTLIQSKHSQIRRNGIYCFFLGLRRSPLFANHFISSRVFDRMDIASSPDLCLACISYSVCALDDEKLEILFMRHSLDGIVETIKNPDICVYSLNALTNYALRGPSYVKKLIDARAINVCHEVYSSAQVNTKNLISIFVASLFACGASSDLDPYFDNLVIEILTSGLDSEDEYVNELCSGVLKQYAARYPDSYGYLYSMYSLYSF